MTTYEHQSWNGFALGLLALAFFTMLTLGAELLHGDRLDNQPIPPDAVTHCEGRLR